MLWTGDLKETNMQLVLLGWVIYHSKLLTTQLDWPGWLSLWGWRTMNRAKSTHHKISQSQGFHISVLDIGIGNEHGDVNRSLAAQFIRKGIYMFYMPPIYICPIHRITVWPKNGVRLMRTKAAWDDDTYYTGTSQKIIIESLQHMENCGLNPHPSKT